MAAEVHDIGKMAVPTENLTKPGLINPLEFELVTRHAQVGSDNLTKVSPSWPIAEVALQHHVPLDGFGHQRGVSGDEIILLRGSWRSPMSSRQ